MDGIGKLSRASTALMVVLASAGFAVPVQADSSSALVLLRALPSVPEHVGGYDRSLFADWQDRDGDGCDTRDEVLIAEAVAGVVQGCEVIGGRWVSLYDGSVVSDASALDIDHVVALSEAWDSGAWRWNAGRRARFANDLGYPLALFAVTAGSNRSKSDQDPAEWVPEAGRCRFAKAWIGVKFRWRLAVDSRERMALQQLLRGCSVGMRVPALAE
ncbi:MAG: DUF1524 domain-containing protein [Actinomycetales bacterium]|nr:DUF1524 domain-containing protein [Actinomycetales bacterium]